MAGLGVLGPFLNAAFYYEGLTRLSSQEACVTNYLWPIMLVLFSVLLLGERMTGAKAAAMLCSFAGVAVMSSGGAAQSGGGRPMGIVCCILGAVCYGLFSVLNKKADLDQTVTMMVLWPTTAACALLAGALTETWVPIRGMQWLGLAWLGIASNAVAYLLWALALGGERETAFIANLAYLTPFLSVVISAIFLKEGLQLRALAALVLIVGGILLQNVHRPKTAHIPAARRVPAAKEETP
jgi:drug/metabolite transporter (DMT)-like permease